MYVRDHSRPRLNEAFGFDPTDYDFRVFRITSAITRQVFPFTLDIDNPRFGAGLDELSKTMRRIDAAREQGGLVNRVRVAGLTLKCVGTFLGLYLLPTVPNEVPAQVRFNPAW
jgi:magnesium-protoporphyrin IX monomethyl ester (oxidative) cyclase